MGLFNVFKKKDVPESLPNLGIDEINAKITAEIEKQQFPINSSRQSIPLQISQPQASAQNNPQQNPEADSAKRYKPLPIEQNQNISQLVQRAPEQTEEQREQPKNSSDEKGYFKDMLKGIGDDFNDMENLYDKSVMSKDVVHQMKKYWESQKPEAFLNNIGGELKEKINEKTESMHTLEKEWQNIYFALLAKEDQIRKEESELKGMLSEFLGLYKKATRAPRKTAEVSSKKKSRRK